MPSRRSVVAAGAWTAPAVAVAAAAPKFSAASGQCAIGQYTIDWANHYNANTRQAIAELGELGSGYNGGTSLTMSVSNQFLGGRMGAYDYDDNQGRQYRNMRVSPANVGGLGTRGLTLVQRLDSNTSPGNSSTARRGHRQQVTFTFNRAVTGLQFTVTDIDAATNQYRDRIDVTGSVSSSAPGGSTVVGAGSATNPWRNSSDNIDANLITGGAGNINVSFTQPVSTFTLAFWNDQPGSGWFNTIQGRGQQAVFISRLTFNASTCAP